eukprot:c34650_g1_i1 orf=113-748(+)
MASATAMAAATCFPVAIHHLYSLPLIDPPPHFSPRSFLHSYIRTFPLPPPPCHPSLLYNAGGLFSLSFPVFAPLSLQGYRELSWRWKRRVPSPCRVRIDVVAEKTDIYRAIGTIVRTARDIVDAGIKLVPEPVPRPLAQAGVTAVSLLVASFIVKSIFSTALFTLAIGGVGYVIFFYMNKDDGPGGGSGGTNGRTTDQALEEARRIMEKYK